MVVLVQGGPDQDRRGGLSLQGISPITAIPAGVLAGDAYMRRSQEGSATYMMGGEPSFLSLDNPSLPGLD